MSFRKQRPLVTTMHRVLNSTNAPHDSLSLDIVAHSFPLEVIVARTILWESLGAMPVSKIAEVSLLPLADVKKAVYALETAGLVKIYRDFPDELGDVRSLSLCARMYVLVVCIGCMYTRVTKGGPCVAVCIA